MENKELNELKAYVFAMYYNQPVQCNINRPNEHFLSLPEYAKSEGWYLLLRPLSAITDEQAIEVARIEGLRHAEVTKRTSTYIELKDDSYALIIQFNGVIKLYKNNLPYYLYSNLVDVLRQSGFALPIYFKGVQYSVERLVELGIIKLNQINQ